MKQEREEQKKMRPNIPQWWRIHSYFHLLVLKSFPNEQARWWLFPRQVLLLLWHIWYVEDRARQVQPSLKGLGGTKMESEKADTAARCCLAGEGPRLQLHAWLSVFQGSSSGDLLHPLLLPNPLQRAVAAELQSTCRLFGEGAAFFQQQSGHQALEADCEPTVWEEGVCVQFPSCGLFVPENLSCFLLDTF